MTTKEVILALAPDLTKMKAKGFTTQKMVDILKEHQISIKGATLNRYLAKHKMAATKGDEGLPGEVPNKGTEHQLPDYPGLI